MMKIKYNFLVLFSLFIVQLQAQTFKRKPSETATDFAVRNRPDPDYGLSGKVIETKLWDGKTAVILAFYYTDKQDEGTWVEGHIFIPSGPDTYKMIFIDGYNPEGSPCSIESVFFANADKDADKELVILCRWTQGNPHGIMGQFYQVYFYDKIDFKNPPNQPAQLKHLEKAFPFEYDGKNDVGEVSKAKYKTADAIRKKLKELGY
jgi:hypothetical protein